MSDPSIIVYYKKKIENHINQDEVVFDSLTKIGNFPMTADILRETGIAEFLQHVASRKNAHNHQNIYAKAHSVLKKWRAEKLWDYPVTTHRRISSHHEAGPSRLSQGNYTGLNADSTPSCSQNVNPRPCLAPKNYHSKAKHGSIPQVFKSDRDPGQNHISVDPNKHYNRDKSNPEWDNDSVQNHKSFNNSNRISDPSRHHYHEHSNPERDTGQNHHSSVKNNHHSDPSRQYRDRDVQSRHSSSTWSHHVSDPNRHYHRDRMNHRRDSGTTQNRNPSAWNDRISDSSRHHRRDQRNLERDPDSNKTEESLDIPTQFFPEPNDHKNNRTLNGPDQLNPEPDHDEKSGEDSNDANLNIDSQPETENAGYIGTTQKPKDPYHLELEEGMFVAIKVDGPPLIEFHQNIYDGLKTQLGMKTAEMRDFKNQRNRISNGNLSHGSPSKSPDKAADPVKNGLPGSVSQAGPSESNAETKKKQNSGQKPETKDNESKKEKSGQESNLNSKMPPPKKVDGKTSSHMVKAPPSSSDVHQRMYDKKASVRKIDFVDETAMNATASKKERRAIYSGKKSSSVPKLKELIIYKIQRNLDILQYLNDTMCYKYIKPLLETFPPMKLFKIEENYKFLAKYTDDLWQIHSRKEYRLNVPAPDESWRNFYLRCHKEANNKLKNVTAQISASASKVKPDRQAKLTTTDSPVDPPAKRLKPSDHPTYKPSTPLVPGKNLLPVVTPKTPVSMNSAHPGSSKTPIAVAAAKPPLKEAKSTPKTAKKDAPLMSKVKKTMGHMHRIKRS
ncbi:uncharacterized protein NPIL_470211 [Nephila pilipes]|uniref:TFIIS N-terminal domain-containing protein n=1 Tax=Nephila pilipes TaxID=299642 RepID=A0A8X6NGR1_NEPPI|nr:uncharacterized protein NPIL_470211 [Nephila pilipes]